MGAAWRIDHLSRMETRNRVHQISLDWLQRGFDSLHPGTRIADVSYFAEELSRLDRDLQMERSLWVPTPLRWTTLYSPTVTHLDRLSRHSGRVHEKQGDRLFREHTSSDLRTTAVRDSESKRFQGLQRI